jgi:hypothetical protein
MATKLSALIQDISSLQQLSLPLRRLQRLQSLYESVVPDVLVKSSEIAFIDNDCLVIFAFHGSAAANLRQRIPTLLDRIKEVDRTIEKIKIEVRADRNVTSKDGNHKKIEREIPATGLEGFEKLANELADSPLKEAIKRLIKK